MRNYQPKEIIVQCPTCKAAVEWNSFNTFRPFCSHRCKLIDLGEWASENQRISIPIYPSMVLEGNEYD